MVEKILEVVQRQTKMNTPMEELKHDISELVDEGHSTVIDHNKLNIGVQQ
ncbi:hypothetical protein J1N35_034659 [Gossypium stocksii]|uniref:Uncharacterized protein n=1 Tax=Gossypium stocksii TaxID=47602 RepID=A0A9D3UTA7_9ROSI|nr:hypothetical protein J1N35_034659 [Gossypium stocksii]